MIYNSLSGIPDDYKNTIASIIECLRDLDFITEIYLFGSVARLSIHVGSDVDILVVFEDNVDHKTARRAVLHKLADLDTVIEYDLLTRKTSEINLKDKFMSKVWEEKICLLERGEFTNGCEQLLRIC
ncbi:nucleotidyltransferase domain-containing protein [Fusibacter sp. 3D3]|uniref:nucleotidyltransferase domain-containing protein n=1 Tax=Fusibacter sp. 3D3 TaxID=1048380 RepID=UPI00085387D6|nr:nucleotidyltransferase domain-containing protein [Fusibacter sp. 3D3]